MPPDSLNDSILPTVEQQNAGKNYWLIASHSGKLINNRMYKPEELQRLGESYVQPYPKPVLRHHQDDSEPIGRIIDAKYISASNWQEAKELLGSANVDLPIDSTGALLLKAHITDHDAIQKIEDDRYMTVSIGFSAATMRCSICGQDWVHDGPCEHEFGNMYDGKLAYGIPGDMRAMEISFVNVPADEHAVIAKTEDSKDTQKDCETYTFIKKSAKSAVLFTDNVNFEIETCGVTSDYKESEEKGEMAQNTSNNKKAKATDNAEQKINELSDELTAVKDALTNFIRLQIANYDAISGKSTEGIDEVSDINSLMDALQKSKQAADEFVASECEKCDQEEDADKQQTDTDVDNTADDTLAVVSKSIQDISAVLDALHNELANSFNDFKEYIAKLVDESNSNTSDSADKKPEKTNEADKSDTADQNVDNNSVTVKKETNPVSVAADSDNSKPKTLRELFNRTFKS